MDSIDFVLLVSRWIHIMAAAVAIGAVFFMRFALLPSVKSTVDEETREQLHAAIRARWGRVVHVLITMLLVSGVVNFIILTGTMKSVPPLYHAIFGVKVLAAIVLFFVTSVVVSKGAGLAGLRKNPGGLLSVAILAALTIVLLSGALGQIRVGELTSDSTELTTDQT